jgi:chromosome segregation ATPase
VRLALVLLIALWEPFLLVPGERPGDPNHRAVAEGTKNSQLEDENTDMPDSIERPSELPDANALTRWARDMRDVIQMITDLSEENLRHRSFMESAQREHAKLAEEAEQLRAELDRVGNLAESTRRERDALREEVGTLRGENERITREHAEAAESAANALGEMKALVNNVANKFQGPTRPSPFAREPRPQRA